MTGIMAANARLVVQISEEVRAAIRLAATLRGIDMGDVVLMLADGTLDDLTAEIEQIRAQRNPPPDHGSKSRK